MNDPLVRRFIRTGIPQASDVGIRAVAANDCFGSAISPLRRWLHQWVNGSLLAKVAGTAGKSAAGKSRVLFSISRAGSPLLSTYVANTCLSRLRGLFAYPPLDATNALLLQPCSAVHTVGFNYAIDVVFLDKAGVVIKCAFVKPYSICICRHAHSVIEMAGGSINRLKLQPGQQLQVDATGVSHE